MRYFNVRRLAQQGKIIEDLGIVDIPESQLTETLKRNPLWKLEGEIGVPSTTGVVMPKQMEERTVGIECPICGNKYKNEFGLKIHKGKHYKETK